MYTLKRRIASNIYVKRMDGTYSAMQEWSFGVIQVFGTGLFEQYDTCFSNLEKQVKFASKNLQV